MSHPRVAVVGAGPAGVYAADILVRDHPSVGVDLLDQLPAPYGLVRYGVAPDHPRIKQIITALRRVLSHDRVRLLGNVAFGRDVDLSTLHRFYDAVVIATGASADRSLDVPGTDLAGYFGAADFVSWYTGHPDVDRRWPLEAESVAVIGAGNVALDVARMLAKPAAEQLTTEIDHGVYEGLRRNRARDVHVFARRGPAHVKFSPMELRELSHSPSIDVRVDEDGFQIDDAGQAEIAGRKGTRLVVDTLLRYLEAEPTGAPQTIHLHLMHDPVEVLGVDGRVTAVRTERTEYQGDGSVRGTGVFETTPVEAVYRAVGYRSLPLPGLPFDDARGTMPHREGRVLDDGGAPIPGLYTTGWVKRGPVGLIGHTKSDAQETVTHVLADLAAGPARGDVDRDPRAVERHLDDRGVAYTTTAGWDALDRHELDRGRAAGRERIKVVARSEMLRVSGRR